MSEPKFENRPFERLNFDDFPTLRETFFLFDENCTPLRDFRVVKKVPLWLAHTRYLFLTKLTLLEAKSEAEPKLKQ